MARGMAKIFAILFAIFLGGTTMAADKWDKVFAKSEQVNVQKVRFKNRYGIELVGDLYIPKNVGKTDKLAAIAIAGPFGAVKEQASGFYARKAYYLCPLLRQIHRPCYHAHQDIFHHKDRK